MAPAPAPQPHTSESGSRQRNPRVLAAFAYAVPFLPALALLARERRNRFVRVHAAQSLVFFVALMVAQCALFVALVAVGGITPNLKSDVLFGLIFYGIAAILGLAGLILWLRLVADAAAGLVTPIPLLSRLAERMEVSLARMQDLLPR
ncbi:MAG TPA: hypothetical protein VGS80_12600 [Ktedonobacterales bacterium]|nr:hypothetical protein [Ktedonobacterales bacterium]